MSKKEKFSEFLQLNGQHPLQEYVPESVQLYKARRRHGGKVFYFNFDFAKEIGLIPASCDKMSAELEKTLLSTFSLVIINEYDVQNKRKFPKQDILPYPYMATRYLQLQHPSKTGKTSGDGRSIWNGQVVVQGKKWDVSSCGTGGTCLSPAVNLQKKFFKTGDKTISYGCGLADVEEGISALFLSEVFVKQMIPTERILSIIVFPDNTAIITRAHSCLLRPSHFFHYLKQGNLLGLKKMTDYYLKSCFPHFLKAGSKRYSLLLSHLAQTFAKMAATFEDEYIFCWLDWDGDNILMDGSIIDYGSVRQFGLFHHEYRYDDVERFSTTIKEQKAKAKYLVQSFAQIVDFLENGTKKNIQYFKNHSSLKEFENFFLEKKQENLLYKMGIPLEYHDFLKEKHSHSLNKLKEAAQFFERKISTTGKIEVADGVMANAVFSLRDLWRELPNYYFSGKKILTPEEMINILKSSYATPKDLVLTSKKKQYCLQLQKWYKKIIRETQKKTKSSFPEFLFKILSRTAKINRYDRVTGDSVIYISHEIMKRRKKLGPDKIEILLKNFLEYQNFNVDFESSKILPHPSWTWKKLNADSSALLDKFKKIVKNNSYGI